MLLQVDILIFIFHQDSNKYNFVDDIGIILSTYDVTDDALLAIVSTCNNVFIQVIYGMLGNL